MRPDLAGSSESNVSRDVRTLQDKINDALSSLISADLPEDSKDAVERTIRDLSDQISEAIGEFVGDDRTEATAADSTSEVLPTTIPDSLQGLDDLSGTGLVVQKEKGEWTVRRFKKSGDGLAITDGSGEAGNPTIALADDVAAVEGLSGTGLAVRVDDDDWNVRALVVDSPAGTNSGKGLTWANGNGVSGNPTLRLTDDLAALEALGDSDPESGTPIRLEDNTWILRRDHYGSTNPTPSDDDSENFLTGSVWINPNRDAVFRAVDTTNNEARWKLLSNHVETRLNDGNDTITFEDSVAVTATSASIPETPVPFDYTDTVVTSSFVDWDTGDQAYVIKSTGIYDVTYTVSATVVTGTDRNLCYWVAAVSGSNGWSWIRRGQGFTYHRTSARDCGFGTTTVNFVRKFTVNDKICVRHSKLVELDDMSLVQYGCSFTIKLIEILE